MSAYRTYMQGKNTIFYDTEFMKALKHTLRLPYRSIWRVLHIDGFEPPSWLDPAYIPVNYKITLSTEKRVFFRYEYEKEEL